MKQLTKFSIQLIEGLSVFLTSIWLPTLLSIFSAGVTIYYSWYK
jgi:hypothetical protein